MSSCCHIPFSQAIDGGGIFITKSESEEVRLHHVLCIQNTSSPDGIREHIHFVRLLLYDRNDRYLPSSHSKAQCRRTSRIPRHRLRHLFHSCRKSFLLVHLSLPVARADNRSGDHLALSHVSYAPILASLDDDIYSIAY
jgi:hypothetical protein